MSARDNEHRQPHKILQNDSDGSCATPENKALRESTETISKGSLKGSRTNDTVTMAPIDGKDIEITTVQKMLAATSGSLLSSLLGMLVFIAWRGRNYRTNQMTVTPMDVVRVRLQSQATPSLPPLRTPTFSTSSSFSNLPPNLGVTSCCREVFWVNNSSGYCVASPTTTLNSLSHTTTSSVADCAVDETRRRTFTSTYDGLRKIAKNEGLTSLWRGLSPTLVMAIPANVIYFTGYDYLRYSAHSPIRKHCSDNYAALIAGASARIAAASVISPIEMFRTRMQAVTTTSKSLHSRSVFSETLSGLGKMVQSQGYSSLWRGLTLTMWRDVPFSGFYWWGYEGLKHEFKVLRGMNPLSSHKTESHSTIFVDSFAAGAVSGGLASIITTPFDVGKTRQQVLEHSSSEGPKGAAAARSSASASAGSIPPSEQSMPRFLYSIWKEEGTAGLFKGWSARCLKVSPACAIMISSFEVGKLVARRSNEAKEHES